MSDLIFLIYDKMLGRIWVQTVCKGYPQTTKADRVDNLIFKLHDNSALYFNPLKTRNPKTGTLANSEDLDEMPHYAAFHQGLHCSLRQNRSSEKKYNIF